MSPETFVNVLNYLQHDDTRAALLRCPSLQQVVVVRSLSESQGLSVVRDAKRGPYSFAPGTRYWIGEVAITVGAHNDLIG